MVFCALGNISLLYVSLHQADIMLFVIRDEQTLMNKRKKGNQILKARAKRAKAKLAPKNKPRYISKAERAQLSEDVVVDTSAEAAC